MLDIVHCGEYTRIKNFSKPPKPAGLIIISNSDNSKEHVIRVSDLSEFSELSTTSQTALLSTAFIANKANPNTLDTFDRVLVEGV